MTSKFEKFNDLHTGELFILPNAWDAESARLLQESNYPAIGTSSAAVATSLGYSDGEGMPFSEYLLIIRRIVASVSIPITVDIEMGYGKTEDAVFANLQKLMEVGVVGINIEDSILTNGSRSLKDAKEFAKMILSIKNKIENTGQSLFINVRCDTFLLNEKDKLNETTHRLKLYDSAGADGIFLPFITDESDIVKAVKDTRLPLNVMAVPGLPDIGKLNQLGVKRVSMGPFLHKKTYSTIKTIGEKIISQKSLKSIL